MKLNSQNNIFRFVYVFNRVGFWVPVLYFYFTESKGISIELSLLIIASKGIFSALFEVPTGIVADKISRKFSLQLGIFSKFTGYLLFILLDGVFGMFFSIMIVALGRSLVSGADESLLYDSLKEYNQESSFKKEMRLTRAMLLLQSTATSLLAGLLMPFGLWVPILASSITNLLALIASFFLKDNEITKDSEEILEVGYIKHLGKSINFLFSRSSIKNGILFLTIGTAMIYGVIGSNKDIISSMLSNFTENQELVSLGISFMFGVQFLGFILPNKFIDNFFKGNSEVKYLFLLFGLFMFALGFVDNIILAILLVSIANGLEGYYRPQVGQIFHDALNSKYRATLSSIHSLLKEFTTITLVAIYGILIVNSGVLFGQIWIFFLVIISIIFIILYEKTPAEARV